MGRVEQLVDRDAVDGMHLGRVDDADGRLLGPPAQDRGHREVARREPQLGQLGEHLDAVGPQPGLLLGLTQGGLARGLARVDRAAGERHLAGVGPHVVGALGQQEVALGAEEQQHRPATSDRVVGRDELRQVVGGDLPRRRGHRLQPVGDHPVAPRYVSAAALTSASVVMAPASARTTRPEASRNTVNGRPTLLGKGFRPWRLPAGSATNG
jgi:hypothetical protein